METLTRPADSGQSALQRDGSALLADDVPHELDPDWDEAFHWSYGPRLRNVGCG